MQEPRGEEGVDGTAGYGGCRDWRAEPLVAAWAGAAEPYPAGCPGEVGMRTAAGGVGGDQKCGKSGSVSFNQIDGYYAFTIYFPSGTTVPSGRYTNKLTNFNP